MPKINLNVVLVDLQADEDNVPLVFEAEENGLIVKKPLTAAVSCIRALMQIYRQEQELSGEVKLNRYNLASKIKAGMRKGHTVHLTAEDVVELKKLTGMAYGPAVIGQLYPILNETNEQPAADAAVEQK